MFRKEEQKMYNDQPGRYRHHRRGRGVYGFPWIILAFFWIAPHLWWMFFIAGIVLFLIIAAIRSSSADNRMDNQQQYYNPSNGQNSYQQPYYQPSQGNQPYQQQPYYRPYDQGYKPEAQAQSNYNPERPYDNTPPQAQEESYQAYDQPKAEYPQQMPPM
jgi:hypothetical protein